MGLKILVTDLHKGSHLYVNLQNIRSKQYLVSYKSPIIFVYLIVLYQKIIIWFKLHFYDK